jgi:hypothetical protein
MLTPIAGGVGARIGVCGADYARIGTLATTEISQAEWERGVRTSLRGNGSFASFSAGASADSLEE